MILSLGMVVFLSWKILPHHFTPARGILLIIFGGVVTLNLVFTSQLVTTADGITGPTDTFIVFCDQVFQGEGQVMTKAGQNITGDFILQYQADYTAGNYTLLWQAIQAEELILSTDTCALPRF